MENYPFYPILSGALIKVAKDNSFVSVTSRYRRHFYCFSGSLVVESAAAVKTCTSFLG